MRGRTSGGMVYIYVLSCTPQAVVISKMLIDAHEHPQQHDEFSLC